jgi:hypothetical protein
MIFKEYFLKYKENRVFYIKKPLYELENGNENISNLIKYLVISKPLDDVEFTLEIKVEDKIEVYKGTATEILKTVFKK